MEEIKQAEDRLKVLERIKDYELNKRFNDDVEEDDPAITIKPKDVDYTIKNCLAKFWLALQTSLVKLILK